MPAAITSSGSSSSTTAKSGPRSWSRRSPRAGFATSSASTGPSTRWSRRRSWRLARRGCRLRDLLLEFRKLAVLVERPAAPRSGRPSLCCTISPRGGRAAGRRPGPEALAAMTGPRMRIRTPSRLHFGLLGWGPRLAPAVRRPRPDDRVPRYRAHGRAGRDSDSRRGPAGRRVERILAMSTRSTAGLGIPLRRSSIRIVRRRPSTSGWASGLSSAWRSRGRLAARRRSRCPRSESWPDSPGAAAGRGSACTGSSMAA